MTEFNSNAPPRPRKDRKPKKPAKPSKAYPLFAHNNGQWGKKVLGKIKFFGVWADPQAALERWIAEKDELLAGLVPRCRTGVVTSGPTLATLLLKFLESKEAKLKAGGLSPYTYKAYTDIAKELETAFGRDRLLSDILPEDFQALHTRWTDRGWGVERRSAEINRVRTVFNFGWKNRIVNMPFTFGEGFIRPSKKDILLNKHAGGTRVFQAAELRAMIDGATQPMKSMLLLAINGGLGNNDISQMPMKAIDGEWLMYPRPKTGVQRRIPLWTETLDSLREWQGIRPAPRDEADTDLVFLTVRGDGWGKSIHDRPITHECRKLLDKLKINGRRNFYNIRHTFEDIAGDSRDQVATDFLMGHDDGSMGARYRERISDDRLRAVADHVRVWLFGTEGGRP